MIDGATVNGTPVKITDKGVVAGDQTAPGAQQQVNAALAQAGYSDVRLVPSSATPGEGNESVEAVSGTLRVVHRDDKMAQQFQGFAGGGFAVGGAEVRVTGHRCGDTCPGGAVSVGDVTPPVPISGEPAAASPAGASPGTDSRFPTSLAGPRWCAGTNWTSASEIACGSHRGSKVSSGSMEPEHGAQVFT